MTYIEIIDGIPRNFSDGFYCGNCGNHFVKDSRGLKAHLADLWDDDNDLKSEKSKYCQKQWKKLYKEYHTGKLARSEDGIRIGFFEKDVEPVLNLIKQFEKDLDDLGYEIDGNIADIVERKK
jgi:hypothetical protein